ncbi:MAG TPA: phage terminase large subunit family protein [Acetobacteraceae bacterium]|nr:phage terminase large subunit family protein [Acetobacteraceae bacterium]
MLRPPPLLTVSKWAERHRVLSSRASAEPGPWRTSRTPYLREVMDALSTAHPARRVVFMKGAQVGATESGNCWIGYVLHHVPAPVLAVQSTVELAKRFSRQRIDPLVEEMPALEARVAPARARDSGNTLLSKEFPGGILVLTGASSAVGLRSMTARSLFLDEVDAYLGDVEAEGPSAAGAASWNGAGRAFAGRPLPVGYGLGLGAQGRHPLLMRCEGGAPSLTGDAGAQAGA